MAPNDGKPVFPRISWGEAKGRKVVAISVGVIGGVMILIGLAHNIVGLPLVLEATRNGAINLPSVRDTGVGLHLSREPIIYGHLFMGVDTCVFGAILLLCAPDLMKGRRSVWRICMLIGFMELTGYVVGSTNSSSIIAWLACRPTRSRLSPPSF